MKSKRKDRRVVIRLTPAEKALYQAMADSEGITLSELVRRICNEAVQR